VNKRSLPSAGDAREEKLTTVDMLGVQAIVLRRNPNRLGGLCTVSVVMQGREVELLSHAGDLVDAMVWPLGIRARLDQAGIA